MVYPFVLLSWIKKYYYLCGMEKQSVSFGALCVHEAADKRMNKSHILPIYASSSFEFETIQQGIDIFNGTDGGYVYSRYGNPTIETVAEKIAQLEAYGTPDAATAWGIMTASGMAAIATLMQSILQTGDKLLTQANLYGGTTMLFEQVLGRMGIQTVFADLRNTELVQAALEQDETIRAVYIETPANPTLACVDIAAVASICRAFDCLVVADNTFCTPYIQRPLALGADFVVHSTTKYLNGHGNSIAGIVIGTNPHYYMNVLSTMRLLGTNCNAFDAWLTNSGLKTLTLRMDKHADNALQLAHNLLNHPQVAQVNYAGLPSHPDYAIATRQMRTGGGMLSFELKGGMDAALRCMNRLKFCTLAPTLGDVDTLILHPATMSHRTIPVAVRQQQGITDGLIRVSVGIEPFADIWNDLEQAIG
jgi:methionine-gamma-lyase